MVAQRLADDGLEVGEGAGLGVGGGLEGGEGGADFGLELGPDAGVLEAEVEEGAHGDGGCVGAGDDWDGGVSKVLGNEKKGGSRLRSR